MSANILKSMLDRKSTARLQEPAPGALDLETMIQAAMTVPDHGSLKPYRFIVVQGEARKSFAQAMVASVAEKKGELPEAMIQKIEAKTTVAPMQIVIIFSPKLETKIVEWEQFASAACTGFALSLAAHVLGYGTIWKSFDGGSGEPLRKLFNMTKDEKVLGWINVGTKVPGHDTPRTQTLTKDYMSVLAVGKPAENA